MYFPRCVATVIETTRGAGRGDGGVVRRLLRQFEYPAEATEGLELLLEALGDRLEVRRVVDFPARHHHEPFGDPLLPTSIFDVGAFCVPRLEDGEFAVVDLLVEELCRFHIGTECFGVDEGEPIEDEGLVRADSLAEIGGDLTDRLACQTSQVVLLLACHEDVRQYEVAGVGENPEPRPPVCTRELLCYSGEEGPGYATEAADDHDEHDPHGPHEESAWRGQEYELADIVEGLDFYQRTHRFILQVQGFGVTEQLTTLFGVSQSIPLPNALFCAILASSLNFVSFCISVWVFPVIAAHRRINVAARLILPSLKGPCKPAHTARNRSVRTAPALFAVTIKDVR